MTDSTLPAGFVDLGTHAIHVAQLRQYTTDLDRFMRHLPLCRELEHHDPMSSDAKRLYEQAESFDALMATMEELAAMQCAAADELQAELKRREGTA